MALASIHFSSQDKTYFCQGDWTVKCITDVTKSAINIPSAITKKIILNGKEISALDSSGAWELVKLQQKIQQKNIAVEYQDFLPEYLSLIELINSYSKDYHEPQTAKPLNWFARFGKKTIEQLEHSHSFLTFIGETTLITCRTLAKPLRLPWRELFSVIEITGYQALFIIALLSFMIGVVLTYQMGLQLSTYGANIYIVDLLGMAVFREFASLLTAIIIAGRTGSAFTAQLGTMKINEEIDALRSMGIAPASLLILPKILGLVIVLPLLTMWSDFFGIFGGMVMSKIMLDIPYIDFLQRFQQVVSVGSFWIGISKAPVFALLIASIGCFQGMQVENGADSIGRQTTKSVVQGIFAIIVADAIFSILFSKLGI